MKNHLAPVLLICALIAASCASPPSPPQAPGAGKLFSIRILQDGKNVAPVGDLYRLKPRPFSLQFSMAPDQTVYINFSQNTALYEAAQNKADITAILGFGGTGLAEVADGTETQIFLTDTGWHVWSHESRELTRFTKVDIAKNRMTAQRLVTAITEGNETTPVARIKRLDLYVVYCDVAYKGDYTYDLKNSDYIRISIAE